MVAGNTNIVANKAYCHRQYWLMRNSQLYWTLQNTWTYPNAQTYVERLFREVPTSANHQQNKLVVVTNITGSGSSYHVAEELALSAGMHLILLSKKKEKLRFIEENLLREAKRRGVAANQNYKRPTVYKVQYDPNSLASVLQAAQDIRHIAASEQYDNQLSMLIHNPSGVTVAYDTTQDGVEINMGRNFMAPFVLTQQLLPLLKAAAAATPPNEYKPRVLCVASVGHCQGTDMDPQRFLQFPEEGGAPEGTLVAPGSQQQQTSGDYTAAASTEEEEEEEATATTSATTTKLQYVENEELDGPVTMYYRATMALIVNAMALAREEPTLAPLTMYPGSVATSQKKSLGIAETIYQTGFYMFNLSPRQGARACLRAAFDPDIDTGALASGSYLHCDGNPWTVADPTVDNPNTPGIPYELMEYAIQVRQCALELSTRLLNALEQQPTAATQEEATTTTTTTQDIANQEPEINVDPVSKEEEEGTTSTAEKGERQDDAAATHGEASTTTAQKQQEVAVGDLLQM